ncbi:MAG: pseudaminic acid cytidylyltransferase [Chloroflexi bacterium]|nr:pseudaminic acid cytidylyltransferase [Chloroflexota bacterium]
MSTCAIAVIPARGGSKRIPHKNIKSFVGKPIISYSIKAAQETALFDRIIVSTDSEEIAKVAKQWGAEVPFLRPAELADDFTGDVAVLIHALTWLQEQDTLPRYFCYIYATAPFIRPECIGEGFDLLDEKNATTAFSVTTFPYPIFRSLKIEPDGNLRWLWPEYEKTRSNDLPETYHDAGQFYWGNSETFLKEKTLLSSNTVPIILPRYLVQDIDTPEDWKTAELMFKAQQLAEI